MKYVVYVIQSKLDFSFYIGYTSDIDKRIQEHNDGLSRYTSKKKPWEIVYLEYYDDKTDALKREKFLKKQRNRKFYESLISDYNKTVR